MLFLRTFLDFSSVFIGVCLVYHIVILIQIQRFLLHSFNHSLGSFTRVVGHHVVDLTDNTTSAFQLALRVSFVEISF